VLSAVRLLEKSRILLAEVLGERQKPRKNMQLTLAQIFSPCAVVALNQLTFACAIILSLLSNPPDADGATKKYTTQQNEDVV